MTEDRYTPRCPFVYVLPVCPVRCYGIEGHAGEHHAPGRTATAPPWQPMAPRPLKLFLWTEHKRDWSSGVAFALAHDETEARALIRAHQEAENYVSEPVGPPQVIEGPFGWDKAGGS